MNWAHPETRQVHSSSSTEVEARRAIGKEEDQGTPGEEVWRLR